MVWFLQTWAGYIPSALALMLGISFERHKRRHVRWLQLILVCLCCVVLLGFGSFFQSIIEETLFSGIMAVGLGYKLEFTPLSYLAASVVGIFEFGLQCGPILAVLLINSRAGARAINAAIAGVLVLVAQDVWSAVIKILVEMYFYYHGTAATYPAFWHPTMALSLYLRLAADNLRFAVACDLAGGPIAGVLCRWLSLEVNDICVLPDRWRVLNRIGVQAAIGAVGAAGVLASAYFIFIKPVRENVVLKVTKEHSATIQYGSPLLPMPYIWTLPANGILLQKPSDRTVTFTSSEPLSGNVVPVRNCAKPEDAARVAQTQLEHPDLEPFDLRDKTIGIDEGLGSIVIVADAQNQQKVILSVNNDALVTFLPRRDGPGSSIIVNGTNTLSVPMVSGTSIVISTLNVKGNAHAIFGSRAGNVALAFRAPDKKDGEDCRAVSFSDDPQSEKYGEGFSALTSDGIVIHVIEAKTSAWANLIVSLMLQTPKEIGLVDRGLQIRPRTAIVSYVVLDVDEGFLSVGTDQRQIEPNQRVVLAGTINLVEDDDGSVVATGDLPFVTLNGALITKALFWRLSPEMQVAVVTGIAAALGMLLKRVWPRIVQRLRLFS
jgi:hypothetical protein